MSAVPKKANKSKKLSPDDWIRAAIDGLLKRGAKGVQISTLARELGVTPGSFYWHFRDRDDFRDKVLQYWLKEMLIRVASVAGRAGKEDEPLRVLPGLLVNRRLPDLDRAMRAWATGEPVVAAAVAKADAMRIQRVTGFFEQAGFNPTDASRCANTVFWVFLGSSGADPKSRLEAFTKLIDTLLASR